MISTKQMVFSILKSMLFSKNFHDIWLDGSLATDKSGAILEIRLA